MMLIKMFEDEFKNDLFICPEFLLGIAEYENISIYFKAPKRLIFSFLPFVSIELTEDFL